MDVEETRGGPPAGRSDREPVEAGDAARHRAVHRDLAATATRCTTTTSCAARSRFGGIVVQGGVSTAVLNAVVAEDLPGPGSVFLQLDLRFLAPVRPGDVITGTAEVTSARADKPITGLDVQVVRDDGVVAVRGTAVCYTFVVASGAPASR